MDKLALLSQHSDDGDMKIDINSVQSIRQVENGYLAEVLLSDGNWIRLAHLYEDVIKWKES